MHRASHLGRGLKNYMVRSELARIRGVFAGAIRLRIMENFDRHWNPLSDFPCQSAKANVEPHRTPEERQGSLDTPRPQGFHVSLAGIPSAEKKKREWIQKVFSTTLSPEPSDAKWVSLRTSTLNPKPS